tara:strand:- start:1482 stop:3380 length:1899 start_codon:yes stop_codon:yes gene_type:complete
MNGLLNNLSAKLNTAKEVANTVMDQGMFGGIRKGASETLKDVAQVNTEFKAGERTPFDYAVGTGYAALGKPLEKAMSAVTPAFIEEKSAEIAHFLSNKTGLTEYLKTLDPASKRRFTEALGLFGAVSPIKGIGRVATPNLDKASAGRDLSSANVIINNYYDPRQKSYGGEGNWLDNTLNKVLPDKDTTKKGQNKTQNMIRKGLGMAGWGLNGARRVVSNLFNPMSRAMYNEYGLSSVFTETARALKKQMNKLDRMEKTSTATDGPTKTELQNQRSLVASMIETAHSQVQQTANIRQQVGGAVATNTDVPIEFALRAADPNVPQLYFKKADYGDNWYESSGATSVLDADGISPAQAKFAQDHFEQAWKSSGLDMGKARVIVKAPSSRATGDHFASLSSTVQLNAIERAFRPTGQSQGFYRLVTDDTGKMNILPDINSLEKALEKARVRTETTKGGKEITRGDAGLKAQEKNFSIVGKDKEGVWIQFSHPSRAKVEGGMNLLVHVKPNGDLTGMASDLHDFFNELPVVGVGLKQLMPNQVLAVTPPMKTNIFSISPARREKTNNENLKGIYGDSVTQKFVDQPAPGLSLGDAQTKILEAADLRPSMLGVAGQGVEVAQNATFMGQVLKPEEQEQ